MGAGIAYPYQYHVLIDEGELYEGIDLEDYDETSDRWDELKRDIMEAFGLYEGRGKEPQSDSDDWSRIRLIGVTDRIQVGIDSTGGSPALVAVPNHWYRVKHEYGYAHEYQVPYNIERDWKRGINRLLKIYPAGTFRHGFGSAWTCGTVIYYEGNGIWRTK